MDVLIGIDALIIQRSVASVEAQIVIGKVTSHPWEPCLGHVVALLTRVCAQTWQRWSNLAGIGAGAIRDGLGRPSISVSAPLIHGL